MNNTVRAVKRILVIVGTDHYFGPSSLLELFWSKSYDVESVETDTAG